MSLPIPEETLKNLAKNRGMETWNILSTSRFFRRLTSYQKTWLESVFDPVEFEGKGALVRQGDTFSRMYIIRKGSVQVTQDGKEIATLERGDFIGNMHEIYRNFPSPYSYECKEKVSLYAISREDMVTFADKNPGLIMKLTYDF
jgi:CRP-like cAMP-binding protein